MVKSRQEYIAKRKSICNLQRICRGYLARQQHIRVKEDAVYREQLRQEYLRQQEIIRNKASVTIVRAIRTYIVKKKIIKTIHSAVVIQKYWRGYKARIQMKQKWRELTAKLTEIRKRLEEATASAEPEQRLGVRTANAIDYLFHIRDVAQLIHAVKTLDMATRLSEDCCIALSRNCGGLLDVSVAGGNWDKNPLAELLNLVNRCNRSVPHMEVTILKDFKGFYKI
jgi:abnormal spindle-like microcephaly-associated protein